MTRVSPQAHAPSPSQLTEGIPIPHFAPVRVRGGHPRLRRLLRHRRRAMAVGLAVTAAALAATGPPDADRPPDRAAPAASSPEPPRGAPEKVTAPVRIADAEAVRLLRPGDRVDVIAAASPAGDAKPRVVAAGARVTEVPEQGEAASGAGALVVLSVPRDTAARLAAAGASARLAVTLR